MAKSGDSPFFSTTISFPVSVPPSYVGCPGSYVELALADSLLRYREDVGGALLSFDSVEMEDMGTTRKADDGEEGRVTVEEADKKDTGLTGVVVTSSPYSLVTARARAVVFAPRPGHVVTGIVTGLGPHHIGVLIAGTFNASVPEDGFRGAFRFNRGLSCWKATDDSGAVINVATRVQLVVDSVHHDKGILQMECSLARVFATPAEGAAEAFGAF